MSPISRYGDEQHLGDGGMAIMRRVGGIAVAAMSLVMMFVILWMAKSVMENVNADTIMVVQAARSGELTWYATEWGLKWQGLGTITKYPKRATLPIKMQVRFNDGGHGTIVGSVQYDYPLDTQHLTLIHTKFGSPQAIETQLVAPVVNKAVYMTGPLMSSTQSYAERRNDLISYIEDQITNGVYRTRQRETKIADPLTGQEKTQLVTEIVTEGGNPARQEKAILIDYGVKAYNFSISNLEYDPMVERQIQEQQQIAMSVQRAVAEARAAEQRKITAEREGEANVAKAKAEQDVIKQKAVTQAEQELAVAKLRNAQMDEYKASELKRAEADSTYRQRMMAADGALDKKLDTYLKAQQVWAQAFASYKGQLTPNVVMGNNGGGSQNAATSFMDMLGVKFAHDLALDFSARPVASHTPQQ